MMRYKFLSDLASQPIMLNQTYHEQEQPLLRFEKACEKDHTEFENNSPTSFGRET